MNWTGIPKKATFRKRNECLYRAPNVRRREVTVWGAAMDRLDGENIKDTEHRKACQRELVVAYLAYALNDVRKLSDVGSKLLQMTIVAIAEEPSADISHHSTRSHLPH
jgi:hypothetical protein